jgi:hypothetical protein
LDDPDFLLVDDPNYTGPLLQPELVMTAEASLGVRLPGAYLRLLATHNGGRFTRPCLPTQFATSWAPDHFQVDALFGIGGTNGIDSDVGSRYLIAEWGYPDVGVVVGECPSAGHDTVMLDYSSSGPEAEPTVVYVDEDRVPKQVANSFEAFLARLTLCE